MDGDELGAMVTWIGAVLSGAGLDARQHQLAEALLGEGAVDAIRADFEGVPPDVPERERVGAILACIWVAQADRQVVESERALLREVVQGAGVAPWRQNDLFAAIESPVELGAITSELTHPALRELVLALGWRIAASDQDVAPEEHAALAELAAAFGIAEDRVAAIRDAVL